MEKKINLSAGNLLTCIAEIVIGILLLINPIAFTSAIIVVLGIVLVVIGLRSVLRYFRSTPEAAAAQNDLAKGVLFVILGIFCIFKSEWFIITFPILTVLYGILNLVFGISKFQWAVDMLRQKQKYWFVAVIGAALTLIFAVLILVNPFASTSVLWTFIAITLIVEAVVDIAAYILGKR